MNYFKLCGRWWLLLAVVVTPWLAGCGKKVTPVVMPVDTFASAPAELKAEWKAAADCVAKNDFMGAVTNLADLFAKTSQLSPEQTEALNQAWEHLGNRAFEVANTGDKAATEAVLKMRDLNLGNSKGAR
jgi:hypothetical protein